MKITSCFCENILSEGEEPVSEGEQRLNTRVLWSILLNFRTECIKTCALWVRFE